MASHPRSNLSLMEMAWNASDEIANQSPTQTTDATQQPQQQQQSGIRIEVSGPDATASQQPNQVPPPSQPTEPSSTEQKTSQPAPEPPSLQDSHALSTLMLFHGMGLAGDSQDIFDGVTINANHANHSAHDSNLNGEILTGPAMHEQIFQMEQQLINSTRIGTMPPLNEDSVINASSNTANGAPINTIDLNKFVPDMSGADIMNDSNENIIGNGLFIDPNMPNVAAAAPAPIKGGTKTAKIEIKDDIKEQTQTQLTHEPGASDSWFANNLEHFAAPPQETTPRKQHDVSDMDSYKEITESDLNQFEAMLLNTEKLIDDMIDVCNYNGYGLNEVPQIQQQQQQHDSNHNKATDNEAFELYQEMKYREDALNQSIASYDEYVTKQLEQYNFNLSSNAIVDLIGVPHMMNFTMSSNKNNQSLYPSNKDCYIDKNGFILFRGKRLTPHFYFNVLDKRTRRNIDVTIAKIIRDYLRKGHFGMEEFYYPTSEMLKGITPILMGHFELQCKIFYLRPNYSVNYHLHNNRSSSLWYKNDNRPKRGTTAIKSKRASVIAGAGGGGGAGDGQSDGNGFCVVVFPNHKKHLKSGLWSRSVSYFDNIVRGSMFQFIEECKENNGFGVVLLNPNEHYIESESFQTKLKYDDAPFNIKDTETITIPRNESSFAHTITMYKNFILPQVIQRWNCKLLLLSHCNGGDDIIHLLETQPDSHQHIIGIAMLDYYNWSLSQFTKKTKQIIEQRAAIYMSLHGSNESAYGFEPSAAKSPVTIFRTANKEKRYSPCYNTESVIRFFRSKIELHKQQ